MASLSSEHISSTIHELDPIIRELACRASYRLPRHCRQDFVDEAPGAVFLSLRHYDPDRGSLRGWIGAVLYNLATDLYRKMSRERHRLEAIDVDELPGSVREAPPEMLGARDLARVAGWTDPKERVLLLCISGLWSLVPSSLRRRWQLAAGVSDPAALEELERIETRTGQLAHLAALLKVSFDVAASWWYRNRKSRLASLRRVKELARSAGLMPGQEILPDFCQQSVGSLVEV